MALAGETAFVIDGVQGQIRQLDPRSLAPIGDSITLPHGIVPGGFDGKGTLWIGVPTEGTVVAISPGAGRRQPEGASARSRSPTRATTWCCPHWTTASRSSTTPSRS